MYGDTSAIRRLAGQLEERATDLRSQAAQLVGAADRTVWNSVAGSTMRRTVEQRAADLRAVAQSYEDAAGALRHHADEVDRVKDLISHIEHVVSSLVSGALDRLRAAGHAVVDGIVDVGRDLGHLVGLGGDDGPDPQDVQLARFSSPPPGDRAWLDVPDQLGVSV